MLVVYLFSKYTVETVVKTCLRPKDYVRARARARAQSNASAGLCLSGKCRGRILDLLFQQHASADVVAVADAAALCAMGHAFFSRQREESGNGVERLFCLSFYTVVLTSIVYRLSFCFCLVL